MFPRWFDKWNKDNPKGIFGPAVLVGAVGAAVFVAAMVITWGSPLTVSAAQTGPRGTGMGVISHLSDNVKPDPTVEAYYTDAAIKPEPGDKLASEVYQNVQVLGNVTEDNFNRIMIAITQWVAPNEGCAYCHGAGGLESYAADNIYTKVVARRMIQMVQNLNENWSGHVNVSGNAGVNCYTCHRGNNVPTNIWFKITPVNSAMTGWSSVQNRVTVQSQYTGLPSDALEAYLLEGASIKVNNLESRVHTEPGDPMIQNAERTYSLMNYFANSLGVNCTFCHNTRAPWDTTQVTPQWATALLGIQMVLEANTDYLVPLATVLPENRKGVAHGDGPKLACATCHKGYQKPLNGMDMVTDWPELASTEPPLYP